MSGLRDVTANMSVEDKTAAVIELTKELPPDRQKEVVEKGIDKGAWPQESLHRMITILGALVVAVGFFVLGIWASSLEGANALATAAPLLASAIVGGIFGFSQASK